MYYSFIYPFREQGKKPRYQQGMYNKSGLTIPMQNPHWLDSVSIYAFFVWLSGIKVYSCLIGKVTYNARFEGQEKTHNASWHIKDVMGLAQ